MVALSPSNRVSNSRLNWHVDGLHGVSGSEHFGMRPLSQGVEPDRFGYRLIHGPGHRSLNLASDAIARCCAHLGQEPLDRRVNRIVELRCVERLAYR